jgi:glycosyltransferase involved in cell wall biosynthesis
MGLLGLDSHNPEERRLVEELAQRGHRVLYLAPLGIREPSPRAWARGLIRLWRASRRPSAGLAQVRTAVLFVLPWRRSAWARSINRRLVRVQLGRAWRSLGIERPVLWLRLPTPELVAQLEALPVRAVVYECIDDYRSYPHYREDEVSELEREERRLVERADLIITVAENVARRFPQAAERIRVIRLGADLAAFRAPLGAAPADVAGLPRPRLGLVGGLDQRVDFELVRRLAQAEPTWSIVLIGPALDPAGLACLVEMPNVHVLGRRSAGVLPGYLASLDACLIPYRRSAWTDGTAPAKAVEYLASGRPVVATDVPGLATYADVIDLASAPDAFVAACRRAVVERGVAAAERRRAVAARDSLTARCEAIDALLAALPG